MDTPATVPDLSRTIAVAVPVDRAFGVFTDSIGVWWPYGIGDFDKVQVILEPREGGRWYERDMDGSEWDWGRVLAWAPPHRLVVTWQVNGRWQYDPDPARASEIEVRFTADGPARTRVDLAHRGLDRLAGGQNIYDAVSEDGSGLGWSAALELFANATSAVR